MDANTLAQDYYTWQSLGTVAIAAGAVVVASNTLRTLFKYDTPWIPFLVAFALTFVGAYSTGKLASISDAIIAFLNSCLLFCTATGANHGLIAAKPRLDGDLKPYGRRPISWLSPWFKSK